MIISHYTLHYTRFLKKNRICVPQRVQLKLYVLCVVEKECYVVVMCVYIKARVTSAAEKEDPVTRSGSQIIIPECDFVPVVLGT